MGRGRWGDRGGGVGPATASRGPRQLSGLPAAIPGLSVKVEQTLRPRRRRPVLCLHLRASPSQGCCWASESRACLKEPSRCLHQKSCLSCWVICKQGWWQLGRRAWGNDTGPASPPSPCAVPLSRRGPERARSAQRGPAFRPGGPCHRACHRALPGCACRERFFLFLGAAEHTAPGEWCPASTCMRQPPASLGRICFCNSRCHFCV